MRFGYKTRVDAGNRGTGFGFLRVSSRMAMGTRSSAGRNLQKPERNTENGVSNLKVVLE